MRIPDFFIIGAAKSGTTSLYNYLNQHREIYMSPIKEPSFFAKDLEHNKFVGLNKEALKNTDDNYFKRKKLDFVHIAYIRDFEKYLSLFREVKGEKAIGEASTCYMYSKVAANEIKKIAPNAKIIAILRNPVERAFSHYLMNLRDGLTDCKDFILEVKNDFEKKEKGWGISHLYIELGLYYEQLKRFYNVFPEKNIKIILFEDFKSDEAKVCREIFKFLNVKEDEVIDFSLKSNTAKISKNPFLNKIAVRVGKSVKRFIPESVKNKMRKLYNNFFMNEKKPVLNRDDYKKLIVFFEQDIKKLEKIINKNLSHWYE